MAVTAPTKTSDFSGFLKPEMSSPIFEQARRQSVVQQLARQVPLGINGQDIPVVTSKATAEWVAEGGKKPASKGGVSLKTITPKKIAGIVVVSAEVVRANPANYIELVRGDLAEAFAIAFDAATLHGVSTPFGANNYIDATTKAVAIGSANAAAGSVHADLNAGLRLLVNDGKKLTGFALDTKVEPDLNAAVDTSGRPLYIDVPLEDNAPAARGGRLLSRPSYMGDGVAATTPGGASTAYPVAYGGDWTQAAWGVVGGITYDVSTETAVTINGELVSLWEHNLVAIRAEAEYGWLVNDTAAFVKYTKTTPAA